MAAASKKARTSPEWNLPPALIQHIALFISDQKDFYAYLSCFQDSRGETLGHLQHFWELSFSIDPADLWPALHVRTLNHGIATSMRAVATYFSVVDIFKVFDLALVCSILGPSHILRVHDCPPNVDDMDMWLDRILTFPLQHLTFHSKEHSHFTRLLEALPFMPRMHSLDVHDTTVRSLDLLTAFLNSPSSSSLLELRLSRLYLEVEGEDMLVRRMRDGSPELVPALADALATWLQREPATTLTLSKWTCHASVAAVRALFEAVWACPTLEHLDLSLTHVEFLLQAHTFSTPLTVHSLNLSGCGVDAKAMAHLAHGLRRSHVAELTLDHNPIEFAGLKALVAVLPETNVQSLALRRMMLDDTDCRHVAMALPQSKVAELDLSFNSIRDRGAEELAAYVRRTPSLHTIRLVDNEICMPGASALVKALAARAHDMKYLDVSKNLVESDEAKTLNKMVADAPRIQCALFR
ncbi:Aste57867_10222 [Aphanomyces stellatus]|uniref:Aste57867_10222 protein n=1 Tax=Aphanomyces stellatus TaxID=120398 RepID=A0A485KQT1_9STRA|nr:hypothetical protein As57867_010183 [Aphanomyces stellatus]VFT87097.1 Aste57867_10222 [Aphanomyces stellatus]